MKKFLILPAALALLVSNTVLANSTASAPSTSTSSSGDTLAKIRKNLRGNYQLWFRGPRTTTLSGNTSGDGMSLLATHYLGLGYKVGSKWTVSATQSFTQNIDEISSLSDDPVNGVDPFVANNPYLTVSNARIWASDRYGSSLSGYLRYYAPFSRSAQRGADAASPNDAGNGSIRLLMTPSKSWRDGALTFSSAFFLEYKLAARTSNERRIANGNPYRNDMVFLITPTISYAFSSAFEGYLEYGFDLTHSTKGNVFTKWGTYKDTDYLSPGANITVTKRLSLNPFLEFSPRIKDAKDMAIHLVALYSFL
jgi:hypothetical protein